jgi:hypothetical protein
MSCILTVGSRAPYGVAARSPAEPSLVARPSGLGSTASALAQVRRRRESGSQAQLNSVLETGWKIQRSTKGVLNPHPFSEATSAGSSRQVRT